MPIRTQLTIRFLFNLFFKRVHYFPYPSFKFATFPIAPFNCLLQIVCYDDQKNSLHRLLAAETGDLIRLFGTFAFLISKRLSLIRCQSVNPPHASPCFQHQRFCSSDITDTQFFSIANLNACLQLCPSFVSFYNKKSMPDSLVRDGGRQTNVDDSILYISSQYRSRVGRN